ncbi:phospholipase D family protein [Marinobacterium sedimentorum]|uniref:phospholipase D family protein n=1 Tax=Marinobacterium sedimentorum TaxID=2927804 RepID=UPI0020C622CD|nr:phospholipase D family protein [Marinobacterium sedimentorum]MCP8688243.1 phospholipase D family protein [Marinobacterium sedimentorum]
MAKFLNTSATNYFLEELIKGASERLILISPFLKLNDRVKELLSDKNRLKIDVRIVYGKNELQPEEINWLRELTYIRTSFCKNLHAKCYLNEESCIITSLNLYEFSQVNNNEMGIHLSRSQDPEIYREAFEEAQRIIRISDEVRMSLEKISSAQAERAETVTAEPAASSESLEPASGKITSSKLAKKLGVSTQTFLDRMVEAGNLELQDGKHLITEKGKTEGGEFKVSKRFGPYFIWPESFCL